MSPPPAAEFSTLHPEVIESHILRRLDGPALASAACCSTILRHHSSYHNLWLNICLSTWPSTASPRLTQLISTFPGGGPRAFFSQAFPLLSEIPFIHSPSSPSPPPELISAVDIHYDGRLIISKLHSTETRTEWFRCSPFQVDLLEPKDVVATAIGGGGDACTGLLKRMTLSWILIDPVGRRAANLSSHEPVSVERHWLTGELQVRFGSILGGEEGQVLCGIVVTCGGEMQVKEVRLEIEGMDRKHLNGKDSLAALQGALFGKKGIGKNRVRESRRRYREYEEMKRERREREEKREGDRDMLCIAFGSDGGDEDEENEQDDGDEGGDDGAADPLAEISELLAYGQPIGVGVTIVSEVHNRRRCTGGGRSQRNRQLRQSKHEAGSDGSRASNADDGERHRQNEVAGDDRHGYNEERESGEIVIAGLELEELSEEGKRLLGGSHGDGGG